VSYLFLNRYCTVCAKLPETGLITLTGWIIQADENSILLVDENNNENYIPKKQLKGSIIVMLEQKEREVVEVESDQEICSLERN
jgi:hypothetical protein